MDCPRKVPYDLKGRLLDVNTMDEEDKDKSTASASVQSIGGHTLANDTMHNSDPATTSVSIETNTEEKRSSSPQDSEIGHDEEAIAEVTQQQKQQQAEPAGKEQEPVLQDQSNLLPMRQLIVVFAGLSCALFCEFFIPVRQTLHRYC